MSFLKEEILQDWMEDDGEEAFSTVLRWCSSDFPTDSVLLDLNFGSTYI